MASRLNQLFQVAPQSYLERTVLFSHDLASFESRSMMANKLLHHVDIDPVNTRSRARLLPDLHQYFKNSDVPMVSYVVPFKSIALIPKTNSPHRLVFMPEFTCCRLLVEDDKEWLRLSLDTELTSLLPAPESEEGSRYCDSINYWEYVTDDLVGNVRGTAVLYREEDKPWRFIMQQIVGAAGAEVVRNVFTRDLRYPQL